MTTLNPASAPAVLTDWLRSVRGEIDAELDRRLALPCSLTAPDPGARLWEAMRYSALGPGKRLRPAMVIASCEAVGGSAQDAMPAAAAIELVHAYTLVHDDLPAMDDDAERRGRATTHVAFDEATAILAGDGLLAAGFGALADLGSHAAQAVAVLAARAGGAELLAGQAKDLAAAGRPEALEFGALEVMHACKTGALFSAAAELGAIAAGAGPDERERLARFGMAIGIAFQHADDRDDAEFQHHHEQARARMVELCTEATHIADSFGAKGQWIGAIARWIGSRA